MTSIKTLAVRLSCAMCSVAVAGPASAMEPAEERAEPVAFELLENKIDESGIQVFNGNSEIGGNWTSILVARMPQEGVLKSCTATLVGQRVILTAAHCVDQGTERARDAVVTVGSVRLTFTCEMSREYETGYPFPGSLRAYEDFALCWIEPKVTNLPAKFLSLRREVIDLTPLSVGAPVLITGYGCRTTRIDLDSGSIADAPLEPSVFSAGDETLDRIEGVRVSTFSREAREPALCKGDSGGPLITGASLSNPDGARAVRAVNSEVLAEPSGLRSHFVALSSEAFRSFLSCWRKEHPAVILHFTGDMGAASCAVR